MRWNIIVECVGEDGQRSTITLGTIERLAASTTAESLGVNLRESKESLFYCTCSMRTIRSRNVLQRLRAVLSELGNVAIEPPPQKTFDAEGAILERTLPKCLNDRAIALKDLADSARRVDKAAFGHQGDFGQAHQALLKALDRAADLIRN